MPVAFHFDGFHRAPSRLLWVHSHLGYCQPAIEAVRLRTDDRYHNGPGAGKAVPPSHLLQARRSIPHNCQGIPCPTPPPRRATPLHFLPACTSSSSPFSFLPSVLLLLFSF